MRALNQTTAQVKTQAVREIASRYNITASEARKDLFVLKASTANLTSKLLSSRRTAPLVDFKPVEVKDGVKTKFKGSKAKGSFISQKTKDKTIGVSIEVTKGRRVTIRDSYLFFGSSVNPSVKALGDYDSGSFSFNPEGKATKLKTLSVAGALRNEALVRSLQDKALAIYEKTYLSQLQNVGKF
jgi:hypothetical protein